MATTRSTGNIIFVFYFTIVVPVLREAMVPSSHGTRACFRYNADDTDGDDRHQRQMPGKNTLRLSLNALQFLERLPGPIYSIAAVGKARVGKSLWMGQLARYVGYNGTLFEVSDTSESCTQGAWFVSIPMGKVTAAGGGDHLRGVKEAVGGVTTASTKQNTTATLLSKQRDSSDKGGTLLLFDIQGSDIGSEQDLLLTDQISAFVSLASSLVLFFLEGYVETSKVQFFDRVAETARVLRNDSSFGLPVHYVMRRPLKLPKQYRTRDEEFAKILGSQRFSPQTKVFELPELGVEEIDAVRRESSAAVGGASASVPPPSRVRKGVEQLWSEIVLGGGGGASSSMGRDVLSNVLPSMVLRLADGTLLNGRGGDLDISQIVFLRLGPLADCVSHISGERVFCRESELFSDTIISSVIRVPESQQRKVLQHRTMTVHAPGSGLRVMLSQTLKWLHNENLEEFFVAADTVRDKVCRSQMHLIEEILKLKSRFDLETKGRKNLRQFNEWCSDRKFRMQGEEIFRQTKEEVCLLYV